MGVRGEPLHRDRQKLPPRAGNGSGGYRGEQQQGCLLQGRVWLREIHSGGQ